MIKLHASTASEFGMISVQHALEDRLVGFARSTGRNSVILCDRGVMDGSAYIDAEGWATVLSGGA